MVLQEQKKRITCHDARLWMIPIWTGDTDISEADHQAFHRHLTSCPACSRAFHETLLFMDMLKRHWGPMNHCIATDPPNERPVLTSVREGVFQIAKERS